MSRFVFSETPRGVPRAAASLRADLAAIQMEWALLKLALKYNPSQPRVPAGNRDGGQWTYVGGATRIAANARSEGATATDAQTTNVKLKQGESYVTLPDGKMVANPYSKTGYLVSPTADLSPVAAAGRDAGSLYLQMLASPDPDVQQAALPQFIGSINGAVGQVGLRLSEKRQLCHRP